MDIQETRRRNLAIWLQTHSVPPKEKSLFSQLKGGASFGERVARRLEVDYGMGIGYLDRPSSVESPKKDQNPPLSDEANSLIQCVVRMDCLGDLARISFSAHLALLKLAEQMLRMQDDEVVRELREQQHKLERHMNQLGVEKHATREHKFKRNH